MLGIEDLYTKRASNFTRCLIGNQCIDNHANVVVSGCFSFDECCYIFNQLKPSNHVVWGRDGHLCNQSLIKPEDVYEFLWLLRSDIVYYTDTL